MTGLVIRACIVFVLGLGILACATTAPPISSPTPIAAAKETESQADLAASDQICGVKRPDDRYRGTYYSAADLGEGEHASAVAGWGTAQMLAGLSATETVFFVAYCDMREAGLPQVEAHNLAASVALQNEDWTSGRVAVPEGPEALRLVTPYKPLVAALGPAPIPTPEAQVEIAPTVTRPPFVWAADRTPTPSPTAPISTPTPTPIDYDEDNDGLIEVSTLAQLNAMRWDMDGDGQPAHDANDEYWAAFPNAMADLGCHADGCSGYELIANLDFDTNGSGQADEGDAYWNDGVGWIPMRSKWSVGDGDIAVGLSHTSQLSSTFEGNDHTIANLWGRALILENYGTISNLVLTGNVDGEYGSWNCGVLVCINNSDGIISGVTVIGEVGGETHEGDRVGGLVGSNYGTITDSTANVNVWGRHHVGGLAGSGGIIINSTATGNVNGNNHVGGLVGSGGTITDSTASGNVYGHTHVGGLVGESSGLISDSSASGNVSGTGTYHAGGVGGLVGTNDGYTIEGSTATGNVLGFASVGGLVGFQPLGEIIGSTASGNVTGAHAPNAPAHAVNNNIGGLVGNNRSTIRDSEASGAVSGENQIGGLVGLNNGHIERSTASGDVKGVEYIGGLVGWHLGNTIERSEASGYVDGYSYVGGLVGATTGFIRDSEANGDVKGVEYVGGLAGGVGGDRESVGFEIGGALSDTRASGYVSGAYYVGGLAGWNSGTIKDSTAKGYVSGKYQVGTLVGANEGGQISNSTGTGKVSEPG